MPHFLFKISSVDGALLMWVLRIKTGFTLIQFALGCRSLGLDFINGRPQSKLLVISCIGDQCAVDIGFFNQTTVIGIGFLLPVIDGFDALVIGINAALIDDGDRMLSTAAARRSDPVRDGARRRGGSEYQCRGKKQSFCRLSLIICSVKNRPWQQSPCMTTNRERL
jgi:hypothetical protein